MNGKQKEISYLCKTELRDLVDFNNVNVVEWRRLERPTSAMRMLRSTR